MDQIARLLERARGGAGGLAAALLGDSTGPLDLDSAARHLLIASPRLIVVDDVDHGGPDAVELLPVLAARCAAASTALIVTATAPLGLGPELRLGALSEEDLAAAMGVLDAETGHALWLASRGRPGVAGRLAEGLTEPREHDDPVVHLALRAPSAAAFLDVDTNLVRLLEVAVGRAADDGSRARVLARLARQLLGDSSAATRRRALADEALRLARRTSHPGALAEVLDARLHALWDPAATGDRLAAGSEIIDLARAAGDDHRERQGEFWRFVALMELGRVAEAESALAAFAREASAAGDAEAAVMVTARHAMLAVLRGRFDQASQLIEDVSEAAWRAGIADGEMLAGMLAWSLAAEIEASRVLSGPADPALVVWAGAAGSSGPVSHYLGLLAARIGETGEAVQHFREAVDLERQIGALPYLAHSLAGLADTLAVRDDTGQASEHRRRAREIAERLGMTVLLGRLIPPADEWRLARDGRDWVLEAGSERARLRDGRGLHYLRALLAVPGREIRALDLVAGGAGLAASGTGPALDAAARNAYRARLDALTARLDAADRAGDCAAAEETEAERHAVLGELRRAVGLGGRSRMPGPEAERARVNVTRTLRATIERIAAAAPRAAAHLRASIRTGAACRYEPAPGGPSRWHV